MEFVLYFYNCSFKILEEISCVFFNWLNISSVKIYDFHEGDYGGDNTRDDASKEKEDTSLLYIPLFWETGPK